MEDGGRIERLDDESVRRIAAGEVVERPASAVKELVENSLDAGAARVAVQVDGDGTDLLRVRDDGAGMTADELRVAVEEHTTSKIGSADDLDGLATLGFRGEALYTVGAVSRLELRSRPPGADQGHRIVVDNGVVGEVEPAACPPGTVVGVRDLFGETPARRKFLGKSSTTSTASSRSTRSLTPTWRCRSLTTNARRSPRTGAGRSAPRFSPSTAARLRHRW